MDAGSAARTGLGASRADQPLSSGQEILKHSPLLLASLLGITVGVAAVPGQAIAIFRRAMAEDFHWTTGQISLGPTVMLLALAAASPLLGWLADRIRPVWMCVAGLLGLALSLFLFSRVGPNLNLYYANSALVGVLGAGSATVPYARVISIAFVRARGLALGVATVGTGLTAFILPVLLAPYAERAGWRAGYVVLAIAVAVGAVIVGALMALSPAATRPVRRAGRDTAAAPGVAFSAALRSRPFWTLLACVGLVSVAIAGLQLNLLAYLEGSGVAVANAAWIVSVAGIVVIVCRAAIGWIYDRVFAPYATAAVMGLAGICSIGLAVFGKDAGILGALAIGLASGTEFDAIGYLTARYFGARSYGRIYGLFYLLYLVGSALSMVLYGALHDAAGSYVPPIYTTGAILVVCSLLYLTLRRYPSLPEPAAAGPPAAAAVPAGTAGI